MTIRRITISVPEPIAGRIKRAAGDRAVSAWIADVIARHLDDSELEQLWKQFYQEVAPTRAEIRRADEMFKRLRRGRRRRGAA